MVGTNKISTACQSRGVELEVRRTSQTPPTALPTWITEALERSVTDLGLPYRILQSGAGHDSKHINEKVPAGMLFVPSRQGLSHVPEEWTDVEDIATGVQVLYETVLSLDEQL